MMMLNLSSKFDGSQGPPEVTKSMSDNESESIFYEKFSAKNSEILGSEDVYRCVLEVVSDSLDVRPGSWFDLCPDLLGG